LTVLPYIVVPKGYFPQQDSGLIQAIRQEPQTISFAVMSQRQQEAARIHVQDPDVAAVSSFIGVDGSNPTLNNGRMQIALKPQSERSGDLKTVMARLQDALHGGADLGLTVYMQPVQDLPIEGRVSRTQYQMT